MAELIPCCLFRPDYRKAQGKNSAGPPGFAAGRAPALVRQRMVHGHPALPAAVLQIPYLPVVISADHLAPEILLAVTFDDPGEGAAAVTAFGSSL